MTPEEWNELRAIRLTALNTAAQLIAIGAVSNNVSDIIRAAELIEEYLTKQSE